MAGEDEDDFVPHVLVEVGYEVQYFGPTVPYQFRCIVYGLDGTCRS